MTSPKTIKDDPARFLKAELLSQLADCWRRLGAARSAELLGDAEILRSEARSLSQCLEWVYTKNGDVPIKWVGNVTSPYQEDVRLLWSLYNEVVSPLESAKANGVYPMPEA